MCLSYKSVQPVFECMLAGRVVIGDDARAAPLKACGHTMLLTLASHPDLHARLTPKVLRDTGLAVAGSNHPHAQWYGHMEGLMGLRPFMYSMCMIMFKSLCARRVLIVWLLCVLVV